MCCMRRTGKHSIENEMMNVSCLSTSIEAELPPAVTKLELITPFIFSNICANHGKENIEFEIMSLEWIAELRKFFTLDIYPPAEYRTNLTPGGDEFHARLVSDGTVALSVYDKVSRSKRQVVFTAAELKT